MKPKAATTGKGRTGLYIALAVFVVFIIVLTTTNA